MLAAWLPLLATIVAQGGPRAGSATGEPEHVARVLVSLILGANETATELYFARQADTIPFDEVEPRLAAYGRPSSGSSACPAGRSRRSIAQTLRQWFG